MLSSKRSEGYFEFSSVYADSIRYKLELIF